MTDKVQGQVGHRESTVLSIDFDGVLHPLQTAYAVNDSRLPKAELLRAGLFCHCEALDDLLGTQGQIDLIVHSSWRLACSEDRIRDLLGPLGHRMRCVTPVGTEAREASILDVLRRWQVPVNRLVVLDDQAFYFRTLSKNLVRCPDDDGFPAVQEELLIALAKARG